MSNIGLIALDDKWGWATEDADPDRLPATLRKLEFASELATRYNDPSILHQTIAALCAEGAIRG